MVIVEQPAAGAFRPQALRDLARLAVEGLALGIFVSVVLALAVFVIAAETHAVEGGGPVGRDATSDSSVAGRMLPAESSPVGGDRG